MPYIRKAAFEALQHAGNMCSNVCYNLSQATGEPRADSMRESYKAWDKAKEAIRQDFIARANK